MNIELDLQRIDDLVDSYEHSRRNDLFIHQIKSFFVSINKIKIPEYKCDLEEF